jgi:hypothetical protein
MAKSSRRATSPRAQKTVAVEPDVVEVEEQGGASWEAGVAIVTTLLLLAAILFTDYHIGAHYGAGMFFK